MSKVEKIIEELKTLTLVEASELVKAIEETFEVSASAPAAVAVAGPAVAGPAAEEKSEFDVELAEFDASKKIAIIKAVKNIMNLGLAEAKTKVESAPFIVAAGVKKEEAEKIKAELAGAGATVNLK